MPTKFVALVALLSIVAVSARAADNAPDDGSVAVTLEFTSAQRTYLIGEPVALTVRVTNASSEPIRMYEVHVEHVDPEIAIYISRDGVHFSKWHMKLWGIIDTIREVQVLEMGEAKHYLLRVLYDGNNEKHLAFPTPGRYRLNASFPLARQGAPPTENFQSNVVELLVEQPEGESLQVWRQISSKKFLVFLQTGHGEKETALEAAAILKSTESTGYDDALRWALASYYSSHWVSLDEFEEQLIREAAGVERPPLGPFPEDSRLDQIITYHFPERTPLKTVLRVLSKQSGVPLMVHPEVEGAGMTSRRITQPLRWFMGNRAISEDTAAKIRERTGSPMSALQWVREKDGYLLKPIAGPEGDE